MMHMTAAEIASFSGGRIVCGSPDVSVSSVETDSKKVRDGCLFVPLIGSRVDAHRFIGEAFLKGAAIAFSSRTLSELENLSGEGFSFGVEAGAETHGTVIEVSDTLRALQDTACRSRKKFLHMPLVGVTGSVGKTTTREMISTALSPMGRVYATKGNQNSQVGVPITLLMMPHDARIGVIEMGISEPGEMQRISSIVRPDYAVVTRIGLSHIESLKTPENILFEKLRIAGYIDDGHILFLNHDDPMLAALTEEKIHDMGISGKDLRIRFYGIFEGAYYRAVNLKNMYGEPEFDFFKGDDFLTHVTLSAPGEHMVTDALAALSVAAELCVDIGKAAGCLRNFRNLEGRGKRTYIGGVTIVNDAYNASPLSVRECMKVLDGTDTLHAGRRIAVIGDMLELGAEERLLHEKLGEDIANDFPNIDLICCTGPLMKYCFEVLSGAGRNARYFTKPEELFDFLTNTLRGGDMVSFKASHSTGLYDTAEKTVDFLAGNKTSAGAQTKGSAPET